MACDYPHPVKLEQGVGLHYKPFRLLRLTTSFAIQPLMRAIFFYPASNPRSRAKSKAQRVSTVIFFFMSISLSRSACHSTLDTRPFFT